MRLLDYECQACGHRYEYLIRDTDPTPQCPSCGSRDSTRIWATAAHMKRDTVPGGFWVENLDPTPRYFDSNSQYQTELKSRGLTNDRFHSKNPRGPHSTKW